MTVLLVVVEIGVDHDPFVVLDDYHVLLFRQVLGVPFLAAVPVGRVSVGRNEFHGT